MARQLAATSTMSMRSGTTAFAEQTTMGLAWYPRPRTCHIVAAAEREATRLWRRLRKHVRRDTRKREASAFLILARASKPKMQSTTARTPAAACAATLICKRSVDTA
eukprot:8129360-Prorocentrum_lima.AAC.1